MFGAGGGATTAIAYNENLTGATGGYIDSAIPVNRLLLRYDAADRANRPDRAEFFYPQNGPHRFGAQPVNFQEQTTYLEYAPLPYLSGFVEVPARWLHIPPAISIDPKHHLNQLQPAQNFSGFSDLRLGFKYAFVTNPDYFYTFQLRTYLPTGNGATGLGTDHTTLEPGLLVYQRLTERTFFLGEFKDWIPLHGSTFSPKNTNEIRKHYAGNVLTYGAGLMYNLWVTDHYRAAPLVEFVGWTVLGGLKEVSPNLEKLPPQSASGDTIVNVKVGAVFALGDYIDRDRLPPLSDRLNLYVGYGRALTGDWWYKDILRVNLTWYY